jgi:hypothetical protein
MRTPKTFLAACAATLFLAFVSTCRADDPATNNAPAAAMTTNDTQSAQSKPLTKAEKKKLAEEKKQAEADAKKAKDAKKAAAMKGAPALKPLAGPPLPISAEKEQRLTELLQKYKADQITPEQYHTERAKILAEQ